LIPEIEKFLPVAIFKNIFITPPSFMKFCPVVPEICRGQVHGPWKERRIKRRRIITRIAIAKQ
jgi:hypothetical protein